MYINSNTDSVEYAVTDAVEIDRENTALDLAIQSAETEYALHPALVDARTAFSSLKKKYF